MGSNGNVQQEQAFSTPRVQDVPWWKLLEKAAAADGRGPVGHSGGDHHKDCKVVKDIYLPLDF